MKMETKEEIYEKQNAEEYSQPIDLDKIRSLAILGQVNAGKTNLAFWYLKSYKGKRKIYLFGYPIHSVEGGFLLYIACEYCGQKSCRCGAPLDWQGKRLTPRALDTATPSPAGGSGILSRIIAELASV